MICIALAFTGAGYTYILLLLAMYPKYICTYDNNEHSDVIYTRGLSYWLRWSGRGSIKSLRDEYSNDE